MPYATPEPSNLRKQAVELLAESVARQLEFAPGSDLEPLVKRLGGRISYENVWEGRDSTTSGSIRVDGEGNFEIILPMHTGASRDRFTIAHELGHYVLHFLWARKRGSNIERLEAARYGSGRVEYEANWFAAAFLMPKEQFSEQYQQLGGNIVDISERFGVSMAAAKVRAQSLGLL